MNSSNTIRDSSKALLNEKGPSQGGGILHYMSGHAWGSLEREALNSILWQKKNNLSPHLFLDLSSPIDQVLEVIKLNIPKYYPAHGSFAWPFNILNLQRIIKANNIKIIHFYNLKDLFKIAVSLRPFSEVPLIFSLNQEIIRSYRKLWMRPFTSRIDRFVVTSNELLENIWTEMKIHPRKGIDLLPSPNLFFSNEEQNKNSVQFVIGCYISPLLRNFETPQSFFQALKVLGEKIDKPIVIKLFTEKIIRKSYFIEHLETFSKPWLPDFEIKVEEFENIYPNLSEVDLWTVLSDEFVEDFSLLALEQGIPILAPRKPYYMSLKKNHPFIGELFKASEIRGIWEKAHLIYQNYPEYKNPLMANNLKLKKNFDDQGSQEQLAVLYDKSMRLRFLFTRKKLK